MEMTEPTKHRKASFMKTSPALALAATLSLAGCAQYATVSQKKPQFRPVRATVGALVSAERRIVNALRQENREPLVAMGEYLAAAEAAMQQLARNPADIAARDAYNFAVARVLGTIKQAKLDPWTQPLRVPAAGGDFVLTRKPDPRPQWNPALYDFTPADQFDVNGTYVTRAHAQGGPRRADRRDRTRNEPGARRRDFSMPRIYYGVTALIRFEGRRAVVDFEDPLATETRDIRRTQLPAGRGLHRAARGDAREREPEEAGTHAPAAPGEIRRDRAHRAAPALRSEQDGRARRARPDGFARDVDADDQ